MGKHRRVTTSGLPPILGKAPPTPSPALSHWVGDATAWTLGAELPPERVRRPKPNPQIIAGPLVISPTIHLCLVGTLRRFAKLV